MTSVQVLPTWAELKQTHGGVLNEVRAVNLALAEAKVDDGKVDGLEWLEVIATIAGSLNRVIGELYTTVQEVATVSADDRREWAVQVMKDAYRTDFDIDIPWLIEPFESMAENAALGQLGKLIEAAEDLMQKGSAAGVALPMADPEAKRDREAVVAHDEASHPSE